MPKKTKSTTQNSAENLALKATNTSSTKKVTKKDSKPTTTSNTIELEKPKEVVKKVVTPTRPQRTKKNVTKDSSIPTVETNLVVQPVLASKEDTTATSPANRRPQKIKAKKAVTKSNGTEISTEPIVVDAPKVEVKTVVETISTDKNEVEQVATPKRPQNRNHRNKQQRQQNQKTTPSIDIVDTSIVEKPVEQFVEQTTIVSTEQSSVQVQPRKKNKKKKKSKAKTNDVPVAIDIPLEQPIAIEPQQVKAVPQKQQQKIQQKPQQKQQQIQREVKKVKPKLPLNDKSKKLFSYLTPLAKDFIKKVYSSLLAVIPSVENEHLLVCVSGGKDSVVLLDALWYISGMVPMKLHIAHCNHNLRGEESEQDEQFVRFLGKKYSIPVFCTSVNVSAYSKKYKQSIELAARNLRYKFFERIAKEQSIPYILTAHSKDDTVETMLFNLVRGTGIKGITGIPKKRELDQNITVFRPIVPISRQEISEYAEERQLEWREDSSNTNLSYTRNKIRHKLLPLLKEEFNPSVLDTLYRFVEFAKGAESLVAKNVETYLPHVITKKTNTSLTVHLESFKAISMFLKGEILLRSIKSHFEISLNLLHIEGILQLLDKETGARYTVNEQLHVVKERNELIITNFHRFKEAPQFIKKTGKFNFGEWTLLLEKVARQSVEFTNEPNVEYLDEDTLPALLILRHWEHGDKFAPIGMFGLEQNVSDYLTNAKVAHLERESIVVLASTTRIFWVCGHRLSESCKVTDSTVNVLKATFIRRSEKK